MNKFMIALFFCAFACSSQVSSAQSSSNWYNGKVILGDGEELNGDVRYNARQGLIDFKQTGAKEGSHKTFRESQLVGLNYFDNESGKPRKYLSIVYNSLDSAPVAPTTNTNRLTRGSVYFFEVIKEFNSFSVVSRKYSGQENIFFLNNDGKFDLEMVQDYLEKDGITTDSKSKNAWYNQFVLESHLQDHWTEVQEFIRKEKLNLRRKVDLFAALDYYEELKSQ